MPNAATLWFGKCSLLLFPNRLENILLHTADLETQDADHARKEPLFGAKNKEKKETPTRTIIGPVGIVDPRAKFLQRANCRSIHWRRRTVRRDRTSG